ncbi:MAG: YbjN domain-containing protein [Actinomycetales bacterium]|nr:YbjN domain-containing protein [Actinomycetales bacterium]
MGIFNKYQEAAGGTGSPTAFSRERVNAALTRLEVNFGVDDDGDAMAWFGDRQFVRFVSMGESLEVFQVRNIWLPTVPSSFRSELIDRCNTWNSDRIWPKTFVRSDEDGMLVVMAEVNVDFECGVSDALIEQTIRCAISTGGAFFDELEEAYPQYPEWLPPAT